MQFDILNYSEPDQYERWLKIWNDWRGREVFAHPEYGNLFCEEHSTFMAIYLMTPSGGILFPMIKRPIDSEEWSRSPEPVYDVISPYGYGGPFIWGDGAEYADIFWKLYESWCKENSIITTFARLSLFSYQIATPAYGVSSPYSNIVRSLTEPESEILSDYKHAVRKSIKKAIRSNLQIIIDDKGNFLDDFMRIYYLTMNRVAANNGYFFSESFFKTIINKLNGSFVFLHVLSDDEVISSELVLVSDDNIYSFLGGTNPDFNHMSPNNFLKHEIVKWGQSHGKSNFVLGGGYTKDDGIFKYKQAMAPNGELSFKTFKSIHCKDQYEQLILDRRNWEVDNNIQWVADNSFFPCYRS
ncbi:GNAT family N-acetyltransferase [Shewanella sp. TB4-MNA-CIBAN-0142]|uniref:GNAT family N-acetyltransferase n=1 Tax=Shewanella sp. TB4-MNA-CIBAN-0142 TaxID=3140464 RepID=UPI00332BFEF7